MQAPFPAVRRVGTTLAHAEEVVVQTGHEYLVQSFELGLIASMFQRPHRRLHWTEAGLLATPVQVWTCLNGFRRGHVVLFCGFLNVVSESNP